MLNILFILFSKPQIHQLVFSLFNQSRYKQFHLKYSSSTSFPTLCSDGILMEPDELSKISDLSYTKTLTELNCSLGYPNLYRKFIAKFSFLAAPLNSVTKEVSLFYSGATITALSEVRTSNIKLKHLYSKRGLEIFLKNKLTLDDSTEVLFWMTQQKKELLDDLTEVPDSNVEFTKLKETLLFASSREMGIQLMGVYYGGVTTQTEGIRFYSKTKLVTLWKWDLSRKIYTRREQLYRIEISILNVRSNTSWSPPLFFLGETRQRERDYRIIYIYILVYDFILFSTLIIPSTQHNYITLHALYMIFWKGLLSLRLTIIKIEKDITRRRRAKKKHTTVPEIMIQVKSSYIKSLRAIAEDILVGLISEDSQTLIIRFFSLRLSLDGSRR
ncbi:hypothetical protein VP01_1082g2 [Puccinia sorghi]|uniref:Uncharacterized protein n=1 Tax=Puccinia sorghi TaxID=27349 RepID=A0A0L6VTA7_9BASI|nr:hypothetical protein VP01_1082g2 [Puccinia sorghi]